MIPNISILTEEITEQQYPNRTYKINFNTAMTESESVGDTDTTATLGLGSIGKMILGKTGSTSRTRSDVAIVTSDRISGYVDDLDAIKQAIYLILNTERYKFLIYSWDYGVELVDLIGKPIPYILSELPRRVKEALTQDNRISDVTDFEFEQHGKKLYAKFTVVTEVGNISTDLEVEV